MTQFPSTRNFAGVTIFITMTLNNKQQTPRWVKVSGVITIILILGLVILHLTGHNFHHR
jgi:hypothetical protein